MNKTKMQTYRIDGDALDVLFEFQEQYGVWIGHYPCFEEDPHTTASGRRWRNVYHDSCLYAAGTHGDCGTCIHLKRQNPNDLIGVCFHEGLRLRE